MEAGKSCHERPLDFLKIWHNVFSKNIEYAVESSFFDSKLSEDHVRDDMSCQMGQWLAGQSLEVKELDNFSHLISVHRKFHVICADITRNFRDGQREFAQNLLNVQFHSASKAVCTAIDALSNDLVKLGIYTERFPMNVRKQKSIWDESLEVGIPEVDHHHHAIATLIDQVLVNGDIECASEEGSRFLGILAKMIKKDIATENIHLRQLSQELDCLPHEQAHESILAYLAKLQESIQRNEMILFDDVGRYLGNWYIDHLVTYDLDLEGSLEKCQCN